MVVKNKKCCGEKKTKSTRELLVGVRNLAKLAIHKLAVKLAKNTG